MKTAAWFILGLTCIAIGALFIGVLLAWIVQVVACMGMNSHDLTFCLEYTAQ